MAVFGNIWLSQRRALLASSGWRRERLLKSHKAEDSPPIQRMIHSQYLPCHSCASPRHSLVRVLRDQETCLKMFLVQGNSKHSDTAQMKQRLSISMFLAQTTSGSGLRGEGHKHSRGERTEASPEGDGVSEPWRHSQLASLT